MVVDHGKSMIGASKMAIDGTIGENNGQQISRTFHGVNVVTLGKDMYAV